MLYPMQPPMQVAQTPGSSGFAGLLAALTEPAQKGAPAWSDDGLADDVTTLSYERALRAHARYRPADHGDWPLPQASGAGPGNAQEAPAVYPVQAGKDQPVQASAAPLATLDRDLRSASVTVRLSHEECARLRQRAAEAGVTVSAYMRSCTFEAEALRAQVKEALAELRSTGTVEKPVAKAAARRSRFAWLTRLVQHRSCEQRAAQGLITPPAARGT